jgi:hypothetical protein
MYQGVRGVFRTYALAALCTATASCCLGHPVAPLPDACMRVRVDPTFSASDTASIYLAVHTWERALGTAIDCATGPFLTVHRANETVGQSLDTRVGYAPGVTLAVTSQGCVRSGCAVWIMADRIADYAERTGADEHWLTFETAAHELGQVLGLQHAAPGSETIMAPYIDDSAKGWTIPRSDAAAARRALR